jgi:H/ACA ribonucleoprotein complex subunit 4
VAEFVKSEDSTDPAYGCPPADRCLSEHLRWGVVILDKPAGCTSRQASEAVRTALGAEKAGHGGTLDPNVTGVLPVLLDKATPLADWLLGSEKTYRGTMVLHADVSPEALARSMARFVGLVEQVPPVRSRVKRALRTREVYQFDLTGGSGRRLDFLLRCQGGTYVRKLIHDLGQDVGCGANMSHLRRTRSGPFTLAECVSLACVSEAARLPPSECDRELRRLVRPAEEAAARLAPCVWMDDGAVQSVCTGYPLAVAGVCKMDLFERDAQVAMMTLKGELVGMGSALMGSAEIMKAGSGLAVEVVRVLMAKDVYPKWRVGKG